MKLSNHILVGLCLVCVCIYLFVSAPPPLPEASTREMSAEKRYPVKILFDILAQEQDIARMIYTKQIVGPGIKAGLKFSENWEQKEVEAGPLPALLLREVSHNMQKNGSNIGLFLGSDFPIAAINQFSTSQQKQFDTLKKTQKPIYFFDPSNKMYTAMYADLASAAACVSCHNAHADSPKKDWNLGDPMGATTWFYPQQEVSLEEILRCVQLLRNAIRASYTLYLDKTSTFSTPVPIGEKWPTQGIYLPSVDNFMAAIQAESSVHSLSLLLETSEAQ